MHPSVLLRPPLVWLIAAEAIIVILLAFASWHIWHSRQAAPAAIPLQAVAPPPARGPGAARPPRSPQPRVGTEPTAAPLVGPTPSTRTEPDPLSRQRDKVKRVEAMFEDLEWRVTRAAVDALQYYIRRVVLPAVERASRGGQ